ncbi:MAG: DUF4832 domain-containing protein [Candidatus Gastranaerophilales bacterium]|nr:DUF4832 domain-containing protein [Candidatus Gastranaerophilales bacterium]
MLKKIFLLACPIVFLCLFFQSARPETALFGETIMEQPTDDEIASIPKYKRSFPTATYQSVSYVEGNVSLDNPYCGFYHMYGFALSEEDAATAADQCRQRIDFCDTQLMLIEINLKNYSNSDLSDAALAQLDAILSELYTAKKQVILRFLYDWDGRANKTEPASIDQILRHMDQTAPIVNKYADAILITQGTFAGNYGEMTSPHYGSTEHNRQLITHLASVTSPAIFLSVRTPAQLRGILDTKLPVTEENAFGSELAARLGLYNDGMLGSVFDLGTYDDTPFEDSDNPAKAGTRSEELAFQEYLCQYVPNGGEVVINNAYNDLENAIPDLRRMHITYLNIAYDSAVLNKWKDTIYQEDDCFDGISGYDYINAHLGYRYVLSSSRLSWNKRDLSSASLSLTIWNTGFAPAYRLFEAALTLEETETGASQSLTVFLDNRTIRAGSKSTFSLPLDLSQFADGTYDIYFSLSDPYTGQTIGFANADIPDAGNIFLGTVTIDSASR